MVLTQSFISDFVFWFSGYFALKSMNINFILYFLASRSSILLKCACLNIKLVFVNIYLWKESFYEV